LSTFLITVHREKVDELKHGVGFRPVLLGGQEGLKWTTTGAIPINGRISIGLLSERIMYRSKAIFLGPARVGKELL
jgi:hypothetical protein